MGRHFDLGGGGRNFANVQNAPLDKVLCTPLLKNQPRDVIKMRGMRGEVGKKNPKKEVTNFYEVT